MNTLIKLIITSILSIMLTSCDFGVSGNGNVVTVERTINSDFNSIKVSQGLDLYITQSNDVALTLEADENLHDLIMTEVENNVLKIYSKENIRWAESKKIMLNFTDLKAISATSGSDVIATNTLNLNNLQVNTTSGSDVSLNVNAESVNCNSTSGSDIKISGTTKVLRVAATSGSDIDASNLKAETCSAGATSGADIHINTSKELIANATSGADIKYSGNPEKVNIKDSSAGSVRRR